MGGETISEIPGDSWSPAVLETSKYTSAELETIKHHVAVSNLGYQCKTPCGSYTKSLKCATPGINCCLIELAKTDRDKWDEEFYGVGVKKVCDDSLDNRGAGCRECTVSNMNAGYTCPEPETGMFWPAGDNGRVDFCDNPCSTKEIQKRSVVLGIVVHKGSNDDLHDANSVPNPYGKYTDLKFLKRQGEAAKAAKAAADKKAEDEEFKNMQAFYSL